MAEARSESNCIGLMTLGLTVGLAALVACTRLIPAEYRIWNMTAVGALALFAAARIGLLQGILLTFAAMLISDFILLAQHGYDADYFPSPVVYTGFALYALLGWLLLRRTENAFVIGSVAFSASVLFFVVTNFASWLSPIHGYEQSFSGLVACYTAAVPYYRGTLIGDLLFTGLAFGLHAALSRACFPAEKVAIAETVRR